MFNNVPVAIPALKGEYMKKECFFSVMLVCFLAVALVLTSCNNGTTRVTHEDPVTTSSEETAASGSGEVQPPSTHEDDYYEDYYYGTLQLGALTLPYRDYDISLSYKGYKSAHYLLSMSYEEAKAALIDPEALGQDALEYGQAMMHLQFDTILSEASDYLILEIIDWKNKGFGVSYRLAYCAGGLIQCGLYWESSELTNSLLVPDPPGWTIDDTPGLDPLGDLSLLLNYSYSEQAVNASGITITNYLLDMTLMTEMEVFVKFYNKFGEPDVVGSWMLLDASSNIYDLEGYAVFSIIDATGVDHPYFEEGIEYRIAQKNPEEDEAGALWRPQS